jgi:hypothetical protein
VLAWGLTVITGNFALVRPAPFLAPSALAVPAGPPTRLRALALVPETLVAGPASQFKVAAAAVPIRGSISLSSRASRVPGCEPGAQIIPVNSHAPLGSSRIGGSAHESLHTATIAPRRACQGGGIRNTRMPVRSLIHPIYAPMKSNRAVRPRRRPKPKNLVADQVSEEPLAMTMSRPRQLFPRPTRTHR